LLFTHPRTNGRTNEQLESARAKYEKNPGVRPTHKLGFLGLWGERVDSLEHWEKELQDANDGILKLKVRFARMLSHVCVSFFSPGLTVKLCRY
jgi:hypothetical protein